MTDVAVLQPAQPAQPVTQPPFKPKRKIECIKKDISIVHNKMDKVYENTKRTYPLRSNVHVLQLVQKENLLCEELEKAYVSNMGRYWFEDNRKFVIQDGLCYLVCKGRTCLTCCGNCIYCFGHLDLCHW